MRKQFSVGVLVVVATLAVSAVQLATAWEVVRPDLTTVHVRQQVRAATSECCVIPQGNLAALAARQDLRDSVYMAMADGVITPKEECRIISDASRILTPEEYTAFESAFTEARQCMRCDSAFDPVEVVTNSVKKLTSPVQSLTRLVKVPSWKKKVPSTNAGSTAPAATRAFEFVYA